MTKSKICLLLIYFFAVVLILFLLFYRPVYYKPQLVANNRQLSPYLTHQLIPQFYNGIQLQEPFDLVITQQGINEIVSLLPMTEESRGVNLTSPSVIFSPGKITIAAAADFHGAKMIITLEIASAFDANGLLNVNMDTVKIGAMNVTIPARIIGRKMYAGSFDQNDFEPGDIRALLAASFFDGKPFDPVFTIDDKKIRLTEISITDEKLMLSFVPAIDTAATTLKY